MLSKIPFAYNCRERIVVYKFLLLNRQWFLRAWERPWYYINCVFPGKKCRQISKCWYLNDYQYETGITKNSIPCRFRQHFRVETIQLQPTAMGVIKPFSIYSSSGYSSGCQRWKSAHNNNTIKETKSSDVKRNALACRIQ